MPTLEPTLEQLKTFYRVVRQAVLLSSYIAFVELTENRSLFVYIGRYDESEGNIIVFITPEGDVNNEI